MLQTLLRTATNLVFPLQCEACETPLAPAARPGLCAACAGTIRFFSGPCRPRGCDRPHYDAAYACAVYDGALRKLIHAFKFDRRRALSEILSGILGDFFEREVPRDNVGAVVAVPSSRAKLIERGFNPAAALARPLAERFHLPYISSALKDTGTPAFQHFLSASQREMNVRDRFWAGRSQGLAGKHVLLIDDLITTGHTASACAHLLKKAGAVRVTALALARSL